MEMDVKLAFFRKINNAISLDPTLLSFLVDTYPDFSVRLATKGFDLLELEKIQVSVSNYSSSHYQNLIIAIRLNGGVSETAHKLDIDASYITLALSSSNETQWNELIELLKSKNMIDDDFFDKARPYFNESMVSRFRRDNLTAILATATNYSEVINQMSTLLSPFEDVLLHIQKGITHSRSSWACRRIEKALKLSTGRLDNRSRSSF